MAAAPTGNEQQENVKRGLEYLKSSDQIIGDIVAYCINAYKADPQPKTLERVRQYVQDTANSVSEHILTIAHNLSKMLEQETKEIEQLSYETGFLAHRLQTSQSFMCELFMTKFQVYPRPRKTVHIMRKTIPEDQLPKHCRPKKWTREKAFDYTILDGISEKPVSSPSKPRSGESTGSVSNMNHISSLSNGGPQLLSQMLDVGSSTSIKVEPSKIEQPPSLPMIPKVEQPKTHSVGPSIPAVPNLPVLPAIPAVPQVPSRPNSGNGPVAPPVPIIAVVAAPSEPPDEVKPFLKMLKVGVPRSGVESKMSAAGLDPALLEQYGDSNQPKAGGGNVAAARPPNPIAAALKARNAGGPAPPPIPVVGNGAPPPIPRAPT